MQIVQVSTCDVGGGAERVAADLHGEYLARGHQPRLFVGAASGSDGAAEIGRYAKGPLWKARLTRAIARPLRLQDFYKPGVAGVRYDAAWSDASIIHLHNLHDRYLSLIDLPRMIGSRPAVWTLHDMWAVTGHCSYTLGCQRWRTGCGHCTGLEIYPPMHRDGSAQMWHFKRLLYRVIRPYVVVPSAWLQNVVRQALGDRYPCSLIYNGVDLSVYHPADRSAARRRWGLRPSEVVVLFAAQHASKNPFKGYDLLKRALLEVAGSPSTRLMVVGDLDSQDRSWARHDARCVGYLADPREMADCYRAADVFVHPTRADNCPLTIIEAMACGTAAVSFETGGIGELIRHGRTGWLVAPGDVSGLARGLNRLLADEHLRRQMGRQAARDARARFDLKRQADEYLSLYEQLVKERVSRGWSCWAGAAARHLGSCL